MKLLSKYFWKILLTAAIVWVLVGACNEFYQIAWGTGVWRGEFSRTWAFLFYGFVFLCIALFAFAVYVIWKIERFSGLLDRMVALRERLGKWRWLLWLVVFIAPIWFFQYTPWGVVFQKFYFRIGIWATVVLLLTFISSKGNSLAGWREFLSSLVLTASAFSIAASVKDVNGYPFSLGWSEGNRLWDYSIIFGRARYDYPVNQPIPVLLDQGRQLVSGLPFLFPGVTITAERLWVGLTLVIPYILLGVAAFRILAKDKKLWLIATLWTFLFLTQGPIHAPLVLSAVLVALAWGSPLWIGILLIIGAGYFAQANRFTWMFAPAFWIVMLEFASASTSDRKIAAPVWKRSLALGISGVFGGVLLPRLLAILPQASSAASVPAPVATSVAISTPIATAIPQVPIMTATPLPANAVGQIPVIGPTLGLILQQVKVQPYLWYRLLPNSTYGNGILFALSLAVLPLLIILFYLGMKKIWKLNGLQKLSLILPSLAFLAVGLVASTKIGGGGDLHNMDMFLIGLLFIGVIAWRNGGGDWLQNPQAVPSLMKIVIILLLVFSSITPLMEMRSYSFGQDASWLITLTDSPNENALGMLPAQKTVDTALQTIQEEVDKAKLQGDVLFMDQRQLLTFGFITNVPLVPEYDKKVLMNEALSSNAEYFAPFYADLASHRFSLIVSEVLRTPIQDSSYQFGEENNAWVKWVAAPVLCYYEPLTTIKTVRVQLLVPNPNAGDCSSVLPK